MAGRVLLKLSHQLYRLAWGLAVTVLVLLALYASLGRYYVQYLPDYAHELEQMAQSAGASLTLESLDASWSGLSPVVHLGRLDLSHEGKLALSLEAGRSKLGVISGLLSHGRVDVLELNARHIELHLYQSQGGPWEFLGRPLVSESSAESDLTSLLMGIREAEVKSLSLTLHYADGEEANLWGQRLRLSGDAGFRRLKAGLGIESSQPTRLIAELEGDPRSKAFQLNTYVRLENSSFSTIAPLAGKYQALANIEGSGELWFSMNGAGEAHWQSKLKVPRVVLGTLWDSDQQVSDISLVMAGALTQGRAKNWFSALDFYWENQYVDWSGLQVSMNPAKLDGMQIALPNLDLALTQKRLLNSGALPENLQRLLTELAPQGRARNLVVDIPFDDIKKLNIESELSSVVIESWRNAPSTRGLDGYIEAGLAGGELSIVANKFQLGLPSVYREPLRLQELATRLRWKLTEDELDIRSGSIAARDGESRIAGQISLKLPLKPDDDRAPSMALLVGLRDARVSQRDQYLPSMLSEGLREWLDNSLKEGRIPEAEFLFNGALREGGAKTIQLAVKARDVTLDYHPDWPAIASADAELFLDSDRVWVTSDHARIFEDVLLSDIAVSVVRPEDTVVLSINAKAASSLDSALRVVRESAIREQVGSTFDDWQGSGRVAAVLDLEIPLAAQASPRVTVATTVNADELNLQNLRLALTDIRGPLNYDSRKGLNSSGIEARVFDRPVKLRVSQNQGKPVLVNARGQFSTTDIRHWLQQPLIGFAEGEASFNIDISANAERTHLRASSDLFGVAINLPAPLGKPAEETRLLEIDIPLSKQPLEIDLSIGDLARLMLAFDEANAFSGGSLSLGGRPIPPPPRKQFMIVGHLDEATLDDWLEVLTRYQGLVGQAQESDGGGKALPLVVEDFSVFRLSAVGRIWRDVIIDANNGSEGRSAWQLSVQSRRLLGRLRIPESGLLSIELEHLNLPSLDSPVVQPEDVVSLLETIDPRQLPELDFSVEKLAIGDEPWGKVALELRRVEAGVEVRNIYGQLRGLTLGADQKPLRLVWRKAEQGDSSHLSGRIAVSNIGNVLQNWQFERVMESRSGFADLDISWPDKPDMIAPKLLDGSVGMRFENGRFLRGSEAASGTLRMVGLLNFANIIRRLQFNFKDIFEKGIHYDKVSGSMRFRNGVMSTATPIDIEGPSSKFRISGTLDFNTDLTDMELQATLPVGSNLPWVAAFISGLPVAAGVYIASKLFEEQVDKVSSLTYRVHGPWQQPELEFKRLFGDKIEIEAPVEGEIDADKSKPMRPGGRK